MELGKADLVLFKFKLLPFRGVLRTAAPLRAAAPGTPSAIRALSFQAVLAVQRFAVHTQLPALGASKRLELHHNDQAFLLLCLLATTSARMDVGGDAAFLRS